ncbi:hypothetical protein GCM10009557_65830 [Virgisporangium ochraceum]
MRLIGRWGARLGATAVVAAAGLAATALPTVAAPGVDLAVSVQSGVVAAGSDGKPFVVKVTNVGDADSDGFAFVLDVSGLDLKKVTIELPEGTDKACGKQGGKIACEIVNVLVPNDSAEFPVEVKPVSGRGGLGPAGSFKAMVSNDKDTNKSNDSTTVKVSVAKPGVDIVVWAGDVVAGRDEATGKVERVKPDGSAELSFAVFNFGSVASKGIEFVVQLPEHVQFTAGLEGCTTSSDKRRLTCTLTDFLFEPGDRGIGADVPVKVASNAPESVDLKGSIVGKSLGVAEALGADARRAAPQAPGWLKTRNNADDVDAGDNTDEFVVFVGAVDGGLPVTGPKALAIGGVGAVVFAVGVVLLVAARRRRVVLVTPAE